MVETNAPDAYAGVVELLKAIASPIRLAVLVELGGGSLCVHELRTAVRGTGREVSQPLLSQHLRVLRQAGLVVTTRRGSEIAYHIADDHVLHIVKDAIRHTKEEES